MNCALRESSLREKDASSAIVGDASHADVWCTCGTWPPSRWLHLSLSDGGVARIVLDATTRARVLPSLEDVITNAVLPPSEDTCHAPRRHGIISLFNTRRPHLDTLSLERALSNYEHTASVAPDPHRGHHGG